MVRELFKDVLVFRLDKVTVSVVLRFVGYCFFFFDFVLEREVYRDLTGELK